MKELSIKEKAKRYNEAIKRAKAMIKVANNQEETYNSVITIFPELAESEDEKIRKTIISMFKSYNIQKVGDFTDKDIIAWLEKQGKQNLTDKVEPKDYNSIDPHFGKPIDKVEPKFKVGDWIINTESGYIRQILKINNGCYKTDYGVLPIKDYESIFRLWTIQNARKGEVKKRWLR